MTILVSEGSEAAGLEGRLGFYRSESGKGMALCSW